MGVPGLMKFINDHSDIILRRYELKNSCVVIDGNNLKCQLYKLHMQYTSAFGGDHDLFAEVVRVFFKDLEKCNIAPIVILDGGYEEKKLDTIHKRGMEKISIIMNVKGRFWNGVFFPLLLSDTFFSALEELKVTVIQCFFEADREIAAVAKHLGCPVLSFDSDFFLFDVMYIPFNTMSMKPIKSDSGYYYFECSIYDAKLFLAAFEIYDNSVLPLLAALLGNDYINNRVFKNFWNHVGIPRSSRSTYAQRKIRGIIEWLKSESLESAVAAILNQTERARRNSVLDSINSAINDYKLSKPVILPLLKLGSESEDPIVRPRHEILSKLPDRFIQLYQKGKLSPSLIDIIHLKRYYVQIAFEDVTKASSQAISYPIISAIHKILNCLTGASTSLVVYGKHFRNFTKKTLNYPLENCFEGIDVKNIMNESRESKIKCMLRILSMNESDVEIIEKIEEWAIFIISLIFWMKNAPVTSQHVQSIVLMTIANHIQSRVGYYKTYSCFMRKNAGTIHRLSKNDNECDELSEGGKFSPILSAITQLELMLFTQKFIKLRQCNDEITGKGYRISTIHLYAMFQSVLTHVSTLNNLMDCPYPNINVAHFYSGTILYNLYYLINKQKNVANFIDDSLTNMPNVRNLYKHLTEKLLLYIHSNVREEKPRRLRNRYRVKPNKVRTNRHKSH